MEMPEERGCLASLVEAMYGSALLVVIVLLLLL